MFPCWDEPAFRATFELTVTVPAEWAAVSNMSIAEREAAGQARHGTLSNAAPSMPTYLVHLTAGDLASISGRSGQTRLGVWAVHGQEQYGAVALANAAQILADYNDYFDYPYPLAKLDSIAVPGGFSGAMEDWGAISYNDQSLLVTPSSTMGDIQNVYSIQAHEMAHQWHGDLVTMAWWDDVWLNESFASWRAAAQTDARHPDWHWWEDQDQAREDAMRADARVSSHAIEQPVTNELQAANVFDADITYNKGQAVLRMLEAHLGADHFRDGVRRLMKAHAYSNASSEDLWSALGAASGRNVSVLARSWTEQPGFPVVSVAASCDRAGAAHVDALAAALSCCAGQDTGGHALDGATADPRRHQRRAGGRSCWCMTTRASLPASAPSRSASMPMRGGLFPGRVRRGHPDVHDAGFCRASRGRSHRAARRSMGAGRVGCAAAAHLSGARRGHGHGSQRACLEPGRLARSAPSNTLSVAPPVTRPSWLTRVRCSGRYSIGSAGMPARANRRASSACAAP